MWHGLHFLFTGTASEGVEPACYLLFGGEQIGDAEELGYYLLQALTPVKVQRFAQFLGSLSKEELERRYDPDRMTVLEIYPEIWSRPPLHDNLSLEGLLDVYESLRTFIDATAKTGDGAIVYVG